MRFARLASFANPCRWRARYVLWVTWLMFIGVTVWGVDIVIVQLRLDAINNEIIERYENDERVLSKDGRDYADQFFEDLRTGKVDEAWSKYSKSAQKKPELRQDLEQVIKYLSGKPEITRPKVTLRTGMFYSSYWSEVHRANRPMVYCSFHNAAEIEVPFFIEFVVSVEDGAPRIESCGYMAMYRGNRIKELLD